MDHSNLLLVRGMVSKSSLKTTCILKLRSLLDENSKYATVANSVFLELTEWCREVGGPLGGEREEDACKHVLIQFNSLWCYFTIKTRAWQPYSAAQLYKAIQISRSHQISIHTPLDWLSPSEPHLQQIKPNCI